MPTPFDTSANFVNPDYATPEQLASLREYAKQLQTGKGQQEVKRPWQGISNIVNALVGGYEANRADQMQGQALGRAADRDSMLISALTGGGQQNAAPQAAPPMADETPAAPRAEVPATPTTWGDKEGVAAGLYPNPTGVASAPPVGVQARGAVPPPAPAPASSPFAQRFAGGPDPRLLGRTLNDPMVSPEQKAMVRALFAPQVVKGLYGEPATMSPIAGINPMQTGGVPFGVQTEVGAGGVKAPAFITGSPGGPNMQVPGMGGGNGIDALAEKDRQLNRLSGINTGGTVAQAQVIKDDIEFANQAPNVLKTVGAITENIKTFGDKMTFGPSAPWSQEVKKLAANYAPGIVKDQLDSIAAADSIDKLSGNLGSLLSKQLSAGTGTDAQMLQGLKTVPGLMQSKQGALAMADMIKQAAEKQQQLGYLLQNPKSWDNYAQTKADFFAQHPVINPLTGNPISMDIRSSQQQKPTGGGWSIQPLR